MFSSLIHLQSASVGMLFRNQGADVRSALAPLILNPLSCEHCLSLCCCCWLLSHVRLFVTPWTAAHQASLSFTISRSLLKLMSIELVMPSEHHPLVMVTITIIIIPSSVTLLLLLPPIFPRIRVCSNEWALRVRWSKYWSFSFSVSPSNEYSGLISFRMDWFDLLALCLL